MSQHRTCERQRYVRALLEAYIELPETPGCPRPPDRRLAGQLYDRSIPLRLVQDAFIVASARRLLRPAQAPRLSSIRSLYYFLPVIEELLTHPLPHGYIDYAQRKLHAFRQDTQK